VSVTVSVTVPVDGNLVTVTTVPGKEVVVVTVILEVVVAVVAAGTEIVTGVQK
jgi:hypothetical protein